LLFALAAGRAWAADRTIRCWGSSIP